jgi:type I restriction enzyme M protein
MENIKMCPDYVKSQLLHDITEQGYSLNPGRYVGVSQAKDDDSDFYIKLEELNEELEQLNIEARELEEKISSNLNLILNRH